MNFIKDKITKNISNNFLILLFSFLVIFIKWLISFYYFQNENLINKLIFDIEDFYYYPHIINLIEFDFSPDYLNNFPSQNSLPIPIYSIFIHAFLIKLFGFVSFIFLEFLCLYLYLLILVNFFSRFDLNQNITFITSIFFFILPIIISYIKLPYISITNLENLYSFRFPRPLITSLFFFSGLYLSIIFYEFKKINTIKYILIGITLGLTFVSYYYNFVHLSLIFLFIFILKILDDKNNLKKNYKNIFISTLAFICLVIPFLILIYYSEPDYFSMIGVISLDLEKKIELLTYLFKKLFDYKFVILIFSTVFSIFTLLKLDTKIFKKKIIYLSLLLISGVISPFFFVMISPSISEIYHFLNWTVIICIFVFVTNIILIFNFYFNNISKVYSYIFLSLFLFLFQLNYYQNIKNSDILLREDFSRLQTLIDKNNKELNQIMTFIPRVQVMMMLKNKRKFSTIESSFSSLNFDQLEKSFIINLKFLGVEKESFINILENKKSSWRYNNEILRYLSWYRYQANSLVTFNDSDDFTFKELEHIKNSRPTLAQQIIIPRNEIKRLTNLYHNYSLKSNFVRPDLIVLDKKSEISFYSNINLNYYCKIEMFKLLDVYVLMSNKNICH